MGRGGRSGEGLRIPGYAGFQPGQQHDHGETYGQGTTQTLRERSYENSGPRFLDKQDFRPSAKDDITNTSHVRHMPGYAGHIPALDAGTSQTFGNSTQAKLQDLASTIKPYDGTAQNMYLKNIPHQRGLPFARSKTTPQKLGAPAKVPGYTGAIAGRQHVYARTYGHTTSELGGAHAINQQDKNQFISYSDNRPSAKDMITISPRRNHLPGYGGHIPGLDAGSASTFGNATRADLQTVAAAISPSGPKASLKPAEMMPIARIPRERGQGQPAQIGSPPKAAMQGTQEFRTEGRLPGYTGFQAGSQHMFADTYGRSTAALRKEHIDHPSDKNRFVTFGESRSSARDQISTEPSIVNPVTNTNSRAHVPGYAGHTPTTRDAIGQRFGLATAPSLYQKSKKNVWYDGNITGRVAKSQLPREMGLPRETSKSAPPDTTITQLPGYTGFVQHSKDTFAKTYGQTTRQLNGTQPLNMLTADIGKPFGEWVLAGNNAGTNHLPGYAGHVAGNRDRVVGQTFGNSTKPGIFNKADKAQKLQTDLLPASAYHSGLRMSAQKKLAKSGIKIGAEHWNEEHTTTGQVFQRGLFMP